MSEIPDRQAVPEPLLLDVARALARVLGNIHDLVGEDLQDYEDLVSVVAAHLGTAPATLPVVTEEFPPYRLVDMHVAIEAWAQEREGRTESVIGIGGQQRRFNPLSDLLRGGRHIGVGVGPVEYVALADSPTSTRTCVSFGLFLLGAGESQRYGRAAERPRPAVRQPGSRGGVPAVIDAHRSLARLPENSLRTRGLFPLAAIIAITIIAIVAVEASRLLSRHSGYSSAQLPGLSWPTHTGSGSSCAESGSCRGGTD